MPGRPFIKRKQREIFSLDEIKARTEFVDAGEMEVSVSYTEIPPEGSVTTYKSASYKFGCLPWHIELHRHSRCGVLGDGRQKHIIKVALVCSFNEPTEWIAKTTGTLTMKTLPDKLTKCTSTQHVDELKENFSRKFTNSQNTLAFCKDFPLPFVPSSTDGGTFSRGGAIGNSPAKEFTTRNKHVKFRVEFILHNVRKSIFPILDFNKPSASANAIIKVGTEGKHKFHVNKELLSLFSEGFERMFTSQGFLEERTREVELKTVAPEVFREFLYIIYPSHKRPSVQNVRGLLELARMYFIPTVTAMCEQCLLHATDVDMSVGERLKLADEYGLLRLKANIMQKTNPNVLRDIQGLREDTLSMLVRKLQNRDKLQREKEQREKEQQQKSKEESETMEVDGKQGTSSTSGHHHGPRASGGSSRHRSRVRFENTRRHH